MSDEELRKQIEQDTKNGNAQLDKQAFQWLDAQAKLAKFPGVRVGEGVSMVGRTGVDYIWFTDKVLPPRPIQYSKVEPEPDNNLPDPHPDYSIPIPLIDNYEAYKLIDVLTEILDGVRSINRKLSKRKKK